jgi:hypothetical protein
MDKAMTKRLGGGLRKEYQLPCELPEALSRLLDVLRSQEDKPEKPEPARRSCDGR